MIYAKEYPTMPSAPKDAQGERFMFGRVVQVEHLTEDCGGWILDHFLVARTKADDGTTSIAHTPDAQYAPCPTCRPGRRAQWEKGYRMLDGDLDGKTIAPDRAKAFLIWCEAEERAGHKITDVQYERRERASRAVARLDRDDDVRPASDAGWYK